MNVNAQLKGPILASLLDVRTLPWMPFGGNDRDLVMSTAREMTNQCHPAAFILAAQIRDAVCRRCFAPAPGDPFFVLSRMPLADGRYMELFARNMVHVFSSLQPTKCRSALTPTLPMCNPLQRKGNQALVRTSIWLMANQSVMARLPSCWITPHRQKYFR